MVQADPSYEKALEYAPILWFADREEYFPTLPFFSAFDSVNNNRSNSDSLKDFSDFDEIAPKSTRSLKLRQASTFFSAFDRINNNLSGTDSLRARKI
jgi:hypothetical protein